jgi:hypothetical protein
MATPTPAGEPRAPSKQWYRLVWSLVALGLLAAGAWWFYATNRVYDAVERFDRLAPFGGEVVLDRTGTHTFWVEGDCLSCHDNDPAEYRAVATVSVVGPDGEAIDLEPARARVYNTARREGRSLWRFDVAEPGRHRISLDLDTGRDDWDNVVPDDIAIGEGDGLPVGIVRPMVEIATASAIAAAIIGLVTFVRRKRYYDTPIDERR